MKTAQKVSLLTLTPAEVTGLFHLAYKCGEHRDRETLLQALQADLALLLGQSDWETVLTGILLLYTRIWWTRVWTAQEIVLAREAEVYCGDKHLPWTVFTYLAKILEIPQMAEVLSRHPSSSDTARQLKQLMPTFHYRTGTIDALREHKKKGDISLWYTMRLVSDRKCTDPRDKIYGVLGLLDGHLPMQPDYSLSATQVVIAASTAMLKETGDLRLFGLISDEQGWRDENLPSWVPDFISWGNHGRVFTPIGRTFGDERAFSACPPVESGPQFAFRFEQTDTLLHLSGIGFDQIDSVGEGAPDILDPRSKDPQASHKDTIVGWKALALASDLSYPTGEPLPAAFWRTVLIDRRVNDYHSSFSSSRAFGKSRLDRDDPIIPPADAELEARLIRGLDSPNEGAASHLCYRRFAVLRNGYFGLVPSTAQQGDLVVVLLGGEVPYLLRPAANGRHKVLGEWYVICTYYSRFMRRMLTIPPPKLCPWNHGWRGNQDERRRLRVFHFYLRVAAYRSFEKGEGSRGQKWEGGVRFHII
jgi:hypothetical protein